MNSDRDTIPITNESVGIPAGDCPGCGAELMLLLDDNDDPVALAHRVPWCDLYRNDPDTLMACFTMGPTTTGTA